jgi:dephospho-CoA kinase
MSLLYKIGVTGNICSGKTACVNFMSTLPYCHSLYLDLFGHLIYERNPLFLVNIKNLFLKKNEKIFNNLNTFNETFNRRELGKIVFSNEKDLEILNKLIQPEIKSLLEISIHRLEYNLKKANKKGILFVEGAIMVEAKMNTLFDEIWITLANENEIERRFNKRIKEGNIKTYNAEFLKNILNKQMNEEDKMKYCTEIIDTSNDIAITREKYRALYEKILNKINLKV